MSAPPGASGRGRWRTSAALFGLALVVYSANGREIGAIDTIPNLALPVALLRGDGIALNRFQPLLRDGTKLSIAVKRRGDDVISRYPMLPALVALPPTLVQLAVLDRVFPRWELDPDSAFWWLRTLGKNSAALLAALVVVALHRLLLGLGLESAAVLATVAAAFGSELWVVASQSPWQHGSAALFSTLALLWLLPGPPTSRARLGGAGLAAALGVCARSTNVLLAAPLALWVLRAHGRRALWFLAPAATAAALLVGSNYLLFGNPFGGLGELESLGHAQHALTGSFSENPLLSFAGTLVSPSRGLFVFSPWVLLALGTLPATARRIARCPPLGAALLGLPCFALAVSLYGVWWAGWSFGPRYWTEATPLFAALLGFALVWSRERSRLVLHSLHLAIAVSIALQAIGAFFYPSTWNAYPVNVDLAHERLWDWRDSEVSRCLAEGPLWPASFELLRRSLSR